MIPFYENHEHHMVSVNTCSLSFPAHLHKETEMVLMLDGSLDVMAGGCDYRIDEGDLAVILPNTIHAYSNPGGKCIMVVCSTEMLGEYAALFSGAVPDSPVVRAKSLHQDITYAMGSLEREGGQAQNTDVCKALLHLICARLLECMTFKRQEVHPALDLTSRALLYIGAHYLEPLSLEQAARELCVSKYHLSRIFSGKLHTNFNDYVNQLRLDYAAYLIRSTQDSLTDICYASGFESIRTFNRAFRKFYNAAPSDLRRRSRDTQKTPEEKYNAFMHKE